MKLKFLSWLAGVLGFGLLVAGVAQLSIPAGFIVAGTALIAYGWLVDRASAAIQRKVQGG